MSTITKERDQESSPYDDTAPGLPSNQAIRPPGESGFVTALIQVEYRLRDQFNALNTRIDTVHSAIRDLDKRTHSWQLVTFGALVLALCAVAIIGVISAMGGDSDQTVNTNTSRATTRDNSQMVAPVEQKSDRRLRMKVTAPRTND